MVHRSADPEHVAYQTVRSAFEYSGQKCSACSRLYVPQTMWPAVRDLMVKELSKLKIGQPDEWDTFASAVIDRSSYSKITSYIDHASKDPSCKIIYGGTYSDAEGFFVQPTIIETTDPRSRTMEEEIFGPVLTVYVYNDAEYEKTMQLVSSTSPYALTGSIFARDRWAIERAHEELHDASGNFYINDKSTGAVVGQQPFGGSRASGTNDKAGFVMNLMRWVSPRTIKENFRPITAVTYPSMLPDKQQ
jgi:1-pyrroline-5-carboxylate dehydrogenase